MATTVQMILDAAEQLTPVEQRELIQALAHSLRRRYHPPESEEERGDAIPIDVPRTRPVTDLSELVADFWPSDESADDITAFVARQRVAERASDL